MTELNKKEFLMLEVFKAMAASPRDIRPSKSHTYDYNANMIAKCIVNQSKSFGDKDNG